MISGDASSNNKIIIINSTVNKTLVHRISSISFFFVVPFIRQRQEYIWWRDVKTKTRRDPSWARQISLNPMREKRTEPTTRCTWIAYTNNVSRNSASAVSFWRNYRRNFIPIPFFLHLFRHRWIDVTVRQHALHSHTEKCPSSRWCAYPIAPAAKKPSDSCPSIGACRLYLPINKTLSSMVFREH